LGLAAEASTAWGLVEVRVLGWAWATGLLAAPGSGWALELERVRAWVQAWG
jgi:hypothetical protein